MRNLGKETNQSISKEVGGNVISFNNTYIINNGNMYDLNDLNQAMLSPPN